MFLPSSLPPQNLKPCNVDSGKFTSGGFEGPRFLARRFFVAQQGLGVRNGGTHEPGETLQHRPEAGWASDSWESKGEGVASKAPAPPGSVPPPWWSSRPGASSADARGRPLGLVKVLIIFNFQFSCFHI